MNTTPFTTFHASLSASASGTVWSHPAGERALVLGGGGSAGNAWLIGVVAGLFDGGVDVTAADLIIGTSAGATAAAQITSASPSRLFNDIVSAVPPQRPGGGPGVVHGPQGSMVDHLSRTTEVIAAAEGAADVRRRLGASALELDDAADVSRQAQWRATVAGRLPMQEWPERSSVVITAVDAQTGDAVVFDRESGVDLVDAVAASTSGGAPYGIGDRQYFDGGYRRSSENADLAAGMRRVLVLSPFGGRTRMPLEWNMNLAPQLDELRAGGSEVETIFPDAAALDAFGGNMMNFAARAPAARAGFAQGKAYAGPLGDFWR